MTIKKTITKMNTKTRTKQNEYENKNETNTKTKMTIKIKLENDILNPETIVDSINNLKSPTVITN